MAKIEKALITQLTLAILGLLLLVFQTVMLSAVEIPLDSTVVNGKKSGDSVAFVDVEVLFNEHPMKKRLQDEFLSEALKRKNDILFLENEAASVDKIIVSTSAEINQLKSDIESLKALSEAMSAAKEQRILLPGTTEPVQSPVVESSTPTAVIPALIESKDAQLKDREKGIEEFKASYAQKRDEITKAMSANKKDLEYLEEKHTQSVLADIYQMLKKLAEEESITLILDKNNVLYGQNIQDLTTRAGERLQGR